MWRCEGERELSRRPGPFAVRAVWVGFSSVSTWRHVRLGGRHRRGTGITARKKEASMAWRRFMGLESFTGVHQRGRAGTIPLES